MKRRIPLPQNLKYFLKTVALIFLSTVVTVSADQLGVKSTNIMLIYLIGVLLIIVETRGYFWGMAASVVCVLCVNFFFTTPRYTFHVAELNDALMLVLFLIVCFISGTLMSKLQKHADEAVANEQHARLLYQTSNGYLNISGMDGILQYAVKTLSEVQSREAIVYLAKNLAELEEPYYREPASEAVLDALHEKAAAQWCLSNLLPCGVGTSYFVTSDWKYLPVKSKNKILGVVGLHCGIHDIDETEMVFLNALISQLALAIEREQLNLRQKNAMMEIEREQLKSSLLRSISHDLRTPLTGIAGSSSFLIESFDRLDKQTMVDLLRGICSDATWLNNLVENLLSMTRIENNQMEIHKEQEVVDDIVSEAAKRVERLLDGHALRFDLPEEVVTVPMDGRLIVQVLVNLLDNAIHHTQKGTEICIRMYQESTGNAVFEVEDNGGGISEEMLPTVFDSFVTAHANGTDSHRGIGLGLSICKAIVDAHGGVILVFNNQQGGATFRFHLPLS